ncbi:RagB/SusD family nutrient uptake outer membrane protein [Sinomicrobium oceani]|uniref:RagB/SusD family nutrient uptake outer membrane protein n=1 Tax=Sinomicrobium oceani TaxID=1150368 RepID=UPI00227C5885|nr:RagB/SusD family nutrient uptake outer membrane protein [Sinomicrobium oceani]
MKTVYNLRMGIVLWFCTFCIACEDFVDVGSPNSRIVSEVVFEKDETAVSAVVGIYHELYGLTHFASGSQYSVTVTAGLSADELDAHTFTETFAEFYQNDIAIANQANLNIWSTGYNTIYMANAVLEGLALSESVTETTKKQLEGEAKFIRAFIHFYLTNLYGEIPLITTTDYRENALVSKSPLENVYKQIIKDLEDAQGLLGSTYPASERTRPNRFTAMALLARVYLYLENWTDAELLAGEVIHETGMYTLLDDLEEVFLANSRETIWQISPVGVGHTREGNIFILESVPTLFALSKTIVNAFETEDKRLLHWVSAFEDGTETYYYPYKYKIKTSTEAPTEYSAVLRYAELYLIRAEARARQGKLADAIADLDIIRKRAGLPLLKEMHPNITQPDLLVAIAQERKVELFAEWGHRWLDLKRTDKADTVLGSYKPGWQPTDVLYPIPEVELSKNPSLTQNEGY